MSILFVVLGLFTRKKKRLERSELDVSSESGEKMSPHEIERLYKDYSGLVFRRAMRFLGNESEAEECMHDIFCEVIERRDQFKGKSSPATWLYQITTRHCLNVLRDTKRQRQLIDLHVRPWLPVSEESQHESKELLEKAWQRFSDELKQVCVFHYIDGLSREEIGRVMGCTGRTVGNRIIEIRTIVDQLQGASA